MYVLDCVHLVADVVPENWIEATFPCEVESDSDLTFSLEPKLLPSTSLSNCSCDDLYFSRFLLTDVSCYNLNVVYRLEPKADVSEVSECKLFSSETGNCHSADTTHLCHIELYVSFKFINVSRDFRLRLSLSAKTLSTVKNISLISRKRVHNSRDTICCLES